MSGCRSSAKFRVLPTVALNCSVIVSKLPMLGFSYWRFLFAGLTLGCLLRLIHGKDNFPFKVQSSRTNVSGGETVGLGKHLKRKLYVRARKKKHRTARRVTLQDTIVTMKYHWVCSVELKTGVCGEAYPHQVS